MSPVSRFTYIQYCRQSPQAQSGLKCLSKRHKDMLTAGGDWTKEQRTNPLSHILLRCRVENLNSPYLSQKHPGVVVILLTAFFLLQKTAYIKHFAKGNAEMLTKTEHRPSFCHFILNKKMYKSAYMVQIMRSKRSIKEGTREEIMYSIFNF